MSMAKDLHFNLFLVGLKGQTPEKIFEIFSQGASSLCGVEAEELKAIIKKRMDDRSFQMQDGVFVLDVRAPQIQRPVMVLSRFDHLVDFHAADGKFVDIMITVLSPSAKMAWHLQTVSRVSRIIKSQDLCDSIREAKNEDALRVLFMPTQDWIRAA